MQQSHGIKIISLAKKNIISQAPSLNQIKTTIQLMSFNCLNFQLLIDKLYVHGIHKEKKSNELTIKNMIEMTINRKKKKIIHNKYFSKLTKWKNPTLSPNLQSSKQIYIEFPTGWVACTPYHMFHNIHEF